jgi:hypothetical protein
MSSVEAVGAAGASVAAPDGRSGSEFMAQSSRYRAASLPAPNTGAPMTLAALSASRTTLGAGINHLLPQLLVLSAQPSVLVFNALGYYNSIE